jgi:outer membrane protein OmpA-like peptidoglycan-associated protein
MVALAQEPANTNTSDAPGTVVPAEVPPLWMTRVRTQASYASGSIDDTQSGTELSGRLALSVAVWKGLELLWSGSYLEARPEDTVTYQRELPPDGLLGNSAWSVGSNWGVRYGYDWPSLRLTTGAELGLIGQGNAAGRFIDPSGASSVYGRLLLSYRGVRRLRLDLNLGFSQNKSFLARDSFCPENELGSQGKPCEETLVGDNGDTVADFDATSRWLHGFSGADTVTGATNQLLFGFAAAYELPWLDNRLTGQLEVAGRPLLGESRSTALRVTPAIGYRVWGSRDFGGNLHAGVHIPLGDTDPDLQVTGPGPKFYIGYQGNFGWGEGWQRSGPRLPPTRPGVFTLAVADETGASLAGTSVALLQDGRRVSEAKLDPQGTAVFDPSPVQDGESVTVAVAGYESREATWKGDALRITTEPLMQVPVLLQNTGSLKPEQLDLRLRSSGSKFVALPPRNRSEVRARGGQMEFGLRLLSPGTWQIGLRAPGYKIATSGAIVVGKDGRYQGEPLTIRLQVDERPATPPAYAGKALREGPRGNWQIPAPLQFKAGLPNLTASGEEQLRQVARWISAHSATLAEGGFLVRLEWQIDPRGSAMLEKAIGKARATAVHDFLLANGAPSCSAVQRRGCVQAPPDKHSGESANQPVKILINLVE